MIDDKNFPDGAVQQCIERYSSILETITDGYYEVDLKGNLTFCNRQLPELYGYSIKEAIGLNYRKYIHAKNTAIVFDAFNKVYRTGKATKVLTYLAIKKDGDRRYVEISISLIYNEKGEKTGFRGIARDVTEQKKIELALRESEKKLKERNDIIERDLENARLIQKALVSTEIPETPGIKTECIYLPLDAVGGDYFSFTRLDEDSFSIFLGDVSNHGVTAALFLALIKATTERIISTNGINPDDFLRNLNKELLGNMPRSFLTCIYGMFQKKYDNNGNIMEFIFSNAGHLPPIVYHSETGSVEELKSKGALIGSFENITVERSSINLKKGDRLFIYTDGIPETMNHESEILGFDRFLKILKQNNKYPLRKTLDSIINKVNQFKDHHCPYNDDVVLIGFEIL